MRLRVSAISVIAIYLASPVEAQWLKNASSDIPRTKDGKVDLSAPAPRTASGGIDLSGIWQAEIDPQGVAGGVENEPTPRYFVDITQDLKPEQVKLRPEAANTYQERLRNEGRSSPVAHCAPVGVPAINTFPFPFKLIQMPRLIIILYEQDTTFRQIFTDGRPLPSDPNPSFMGYSIGRWEGDTLVVESVGFKDGGWLDRLGHPHSAQLRLIERYRRSDFGHLSIEMTINDPDTYEKPFTYTQPTVFLPDTDLLESYCTENERDAQYFK